MPALIPFLIAQRGYSFAAAGALLLCVTVGSSIIQPVFGALSDRLALAWLMPAGVALAAVGIGLSGVTESFAATAVAVGIGGLGVAAFHPEGARYANYASGSRRGTGMSLFSVGGNAGFALGPILITPAVLAFGLSGTLVVAIVPAVVAIVLAFELPHLKARSASAAQATAAKGRAQDRSEDDWGAFGKLTAVVSVRSWIYFGLQSFAPIWFIHEYGMSEATANTGARGDARRRCRGHARGRPARGPDRPPQGAARLDRGPDPAVGGVRARSRGASPPACCWPRSGSSP